MKSIKQQADDMLRECRIVETLRKFGEARLHGSYLMDLMVWPEIDVWLLKNGIQSSMTWKLIGELSQSVPPTHVHVINQLDHDLKKTPPESVSIDFRFLHRDIHWKLDICVGSQERHVSSMEYLQHVQPRLTAGAKDSIMAIKRLAVRSSLYRKSRWNYAPGAGQIIGVDIYRAVLFDGVKTPSEFVAYILQHKGIDLSQDFGIAPGSFTIST